MTAEVKGTEEILARIRQVIAKAPLEVGKALYQEALIEQRESMSRTPVDTGALRASHVTRSPAYDLGGGSVSVTIEVGGPAAPYALAVHENLEADHPTGQAKFLESTILESAPHLPSRVAARLKIEDWAK